jgi:predicted regulator of Ras-like GTPase activity (Roadblock/LC7/MglB family)
MSKNVRRDLEAVLKELEATEGDIDRSVVVRTDGLIIAFAMPRSTDETLVTAMSARLLNIGAKTVKELARGDLESHSERQQGDAVLMDAGRNTILSATTKTGVNSGLVLIEMMKTGNVAETQMAGG